jgi:mevalonate kinase
MGGSTLQAAIELTVTVAADCARSHADADVRMTSGWPVDAARSVRASDFGRRVGDHLDFPQMALACLANVCGPFGGAIEITSTLPMAAGLASSAAVLVATVAAVAQDLDLELSTTDVCALAYATETEWLRTGAGKMDFLACAFGGTRLTHFENDEDALVTTFPGFLGDIVVGDSGASATTARSIAPKQARFACRESTILEYQRRTDALVARMAGYMGVGDSHLADIGACVSECHEAIATLMGTSTPRIDAMVASSMDAGGKGAKLTGGGEGGCMFVLAGGQTTSSVAEALRDLGATAIETRVSSRGLTTTSA